MSPDPKSQLNKGLPFRSGVAGVNIPTIGSDFANVPIKQLGLQPKVVPTTTPVMQSTAKPQTQPSQAQSSSFKGGGGQTSPTGGATVSKPSAFVGGGGQTGGQIPQDIKVESEMSVNFPQITKEQEMKVAERVKQAMPGATPEARYEKAKELIEANAPKQEEVGEGHAVGQAIKDVVGGAYDSATGLPRFIAENLSKGIGWIAKELGADQDKVDKLVGSYISSLGDFSGEAMGAKKENLIYKGTKLVGDLAQIANPAGLGKLGIKAGATAGKIAKEGSLMSKVANVATQGVVDTAVFMPQSEQRMATPGELALGGAIGGAIPVAGAGLNLLKKGIQKIAPKLELSGLLNPAKLNQVKNQLIDEGTEMIGKGTNEDVGKWMIERGIKGNKQQIIEQLGNNAKKSKGMVDDLLSSSKSVHDIPSARKALENIGKEVGDVPGLEAKANKIQELMNKPTHTLTELNQIKRELDDVYNLYTKAGGESAGLKAEGLRNIRQQIRKYIEDVATEEGLGNIKMLNNETSIAKTLEDAIGRKDSADMAREMLSIFSKGTVGGAIGTQAGPFNNDTIEGKIGNFLVGSIVGTALMSTTSKTYIANAMRKLSGLEKKELSRFIATKGKQAVSTATLNKLSDIRDGLKALPSPETVSKSNIGTPKNPIIGKGAPKKDIVEIPLSSKPKNASSNPISNPLIPSKENAGLKTVAPVKSEALPVKKKAPLQEKLPVKTKEADLGTKKGLESLAEKAKKYDNYEDFGNARMTDEEISAFKKEYNVFTPTEAKNATKKFREENNGKKGITMNEKIVQPVVRVKAPESDVVKIYRGQDDAEFSLNSNRDRLIEGSKGTSFAKDLEHAQNYGKTIIEGTIPKKDILVSSDLPADVVSSFKKRISKLTADDYIEGEGFEAIVSEILPYAEKYNKGAVDLTTFFPKGKIDAEIRILDSAKSLKTNVSKGIATKTKGLPTKSKGFGKK